MCVGFLCAKAAQNAARFSLFVFSFVDSVFHSRFCSFRYLDSRISSQLIFVFFAGSPVSPNGVFVGLPREQKIGVKITLGSKKRNADNFGREFFLGGEGLKPWKNKAEKLAEKTTSKFAEKSAGNFLKFAKQRKINPNPLCRTSGSIFAPYWKQRVSMKRAQVTNGHSVHKKKGFALFRPLKTAKMRLKWRVSRTQSKKNIKQGSAALATPHPSSTGLSGRDPLGWSIMCWLSWFSGPGCW